MTIFPWIGTRFRKRKSQQRFAANADNVLFLYMDVSGENQLPRGRTPRYVGSGRNVLYEDQIPVSELFKGHFKVDAVFAAELRGI